MGRINGLTDPLILPIRVDRLCLSNYHRSVFDVKTAGGEWRIHHDHFRC